MLTQGCRRLKGWCQVALPWKLRACWCPGHAQSQSCCLHRQHDYIVHVNKHHLRRLKPLIAAQDSILAMRQMRQAACYTLLAAEAVIMCLLCELLPVTCA